MRELLLSDNTTGYFNVLFQSLGTSTYCFVFFFHDKILVTDVPTSLVTYLKKKTIKQVIKDFSDFCLYFHTKTISINQITVVLKLAHKEAKQHNQD